MATRAEFIEIDTPEKSAAAAGSRPAAFVEEFRAVRGLLNGLLLSAVLWGLAIAVYFWS